MPTQTKSWAEMSTAERTVFLAPLTGKRIRVVVKRALDEGLKAFGEGFPMPWRETRLLSLEPTELYGKPAMVLAPFHNPNLPFGGMMSLGRNVQRFDQIAAIEVIPEPSLVTKPATPTPQTTCPHCGKPLLLTAQAAEEQ